MPKKNGKSTKNYLMTHPATLLTQMDKGGLMAIYYFAKMYNTYNDARVPDPGAPPWAHLLIAAKKGLFVSMPKAATELESFELCYLPSSTLDRGILLLDITNNS